jgi:uncharacterized protein (TIGR00369 family)
MMTDHIKAALKNLSEIFTMIPFNRTLGLRLEEISREKVVMSFDMKSDLIGNVLQGILHGGVISSVLDMSGGMAAMVSVVYKYPDKDTHEYKEALSKTGTIDLNVSYLKPGRGDRFEAHARVLQAGNKICFTQMEMFNQDKQLIATGAGTYLVG